MACHKVRRFPTKNPIFLKFFFFVIYFDPGIDFVFGAIHISHCYSREVAIRLNKILNQYMLLIFWIEFELTHLITIDGAEKIEATGISSALRQTTILIWQASGANRKEDASSLSMLNWLAWNLLRIVTFFAGYDDKKTKWARRRNEPYPSAFFGAAEF